MKSTITIGTLCLVIGVAVGWFAKPAPVSQATVVTNTTAPSKAAARPPSTTRTHAPDSKSERGANSSSTIVINGEELDEDQLDERNKQMEERIGKMMLDRQRKQFDRKLADLVKKLGLDATQETKLRAFFDAQLAQMEGFMSSDGDDEFEGIKEFTALVRNDGLGDQLATLLTDDQLEAYDQMKSAERARKVESMALKDLSKLNSVLELTPDQKEDVYDLLYGAAETKIDTNKDANTMMSVMVGGLGMEMGFDDIGMESALQAQIESGDGGGQADPDPNAWKKALKENNRKRIDQQVELLSPALSEEQSSRYREHLESQSLGLLGGMLFSEEESMVVPADAVPETAPE